MTVPDQRSLLCGVIGCPNATPEDGLEVIVSGKITTYAQQSKYQIVIEQIEVVGGEPLLAILEKRRKKLAAEGLFDVEKTALPFLPSIIGVVTSPFSD